MMKFRSPISFLHFTAFSVNLLTFSWALSVFWSSPVIPKLRGQVEEIPPFFPEPISVKEASQVQSFLDLGFVFGPILALILIDKIGRKKTLLICCVCFAIGYIIISFAPTVEYLYASRFILGFAIGCINVALTMYLSEIAEAKNRGSISYTIGILYNLAGLFCLSAGPYLSVQMFSLICTVPSIICFIIILTCIPESPYYLAAISDERNFQNTLRRLRNKNTDIEDEILEIRQASKLRSSISLKPLLNKELIKLILITTCLNSLLVFCGFFSITYNMQAIFIASEGMIPSDICPIIVSVAQLMSILTITNFVDRLGRKVVLTISLSGCGIALVVLGTYFILKDNNFDVTPINWLPLLCVIFYMVSFKIGLAVGPLAIMSEIFPTEVKALASSVSISCTQCLSFVVSMYFPQISQIISMGILFWIYAIFCVLGILFVIFIVPETKGKSFSEIQKLLNEPNKKTNDKNKCVS